MLLLQRGVSPKFVRELLGHADISLILRFYSHVLPNMGDTTVGVMDEALGQPNVAVHQDRVANEGPLPLQRARTRTWLKKGSSQGS